MLLAQLDHKINSFGDCTCGCGSLGLRFRETGIERASTGTMYPVDGHILDQDGEATSGLILWLADGLLASIEVYGFDDRGSQLPTPGEVTWSVNG